MSRAIRGWCRWIRLRAGRADQGRAIVEFVFLGVLMVVPLIYLVLILGRVQAAAYCLPLHRQSRYFDKQRPRQDLWVTDKLADRALALPFHAHLDAEEVDFIVQTAKDASINVGAGSAIYL